MSLHSENPADDEPEAGVDLSFVALSRKELLTITSAQHEERTKRLCALRVLTPAELREIKRQRRYIARPVLSNFISLLRPSLPHNISSFLPSASLSLSRFSLSTLRFLTLSHIKK
jgi:hypothetical protein